MKPLHCTPRSETAKILLCPTPDNFTHHWEGRHNEHGLLLLSKGNLWALTGIVTCSQINTVVAQCLIGAEFFNILILPSSVFCRYKVLA